MTLDEQLAKINAAIEQIENGAQEYQIDGKKVRRGDLATLYRERRQLQTQIATDESSGGIYAAAFYRG